ncbi:hypothetical protein HELRODRAFT_70975 [Helobdella robusta]|uniref:Protein CLP1 homolog n=1 Tax=Helobdella robusta TaxID=6412 RepID=T1G0F2_HELRO|nr:hypothetical protein HELRODRAFT_70975 [Helobdella robusta]ESN90688.1 hypothetical protein HELRODRAFT_70975 [Helobdella robusta]
MKVGAKKQLFDLPPNAELRFEVEEDSGPIQIELSSGNAEYFGTELVLKRNYTFPVGAKGAIFTYHGCQLWVIGKSEDLYTKDSPTMNIYINLHDALDQMRRKAVETMNRGPRVLIVGPSDVGKSTLSRILVNYGTRLGWTPLFIDLDVGQNEISMPGTVSALCITQPVDIEKGYDTKNQLVFHYGHESPTENTKYFNSVVNFLAECVNFKCEMSDECNASGVIINTGGCIRDEGYKCLLNVAAAFEIEVLVVIDNELLYTKFQNDLPLFVKTVMLPKSGGAVQRSQEFRANSMYMNIKKYFYGASNELHSHTCDVQFQEVEIYKIGAPKLPASMLPLGVILEDSDMKLTPVSVSGSLENCVLSTSFASTRDEIMKNNVSGFVAVLKVDTQKQTMTILSPEPRPFSWNILLLMDIKFSEI